MARTRAGRRRGSNTFAINRIPDVKVPRSVLDLSHHHKTTYDGGLLIPVLVKDVLPGDTWKIRASIFQRLSTLLFPVMDELITTFTLWFVAYRLVWDHWKNFMGEQKNPDDQTVYRVPQIDFGGTGVVENTNFDYMGLPLRAAYQNTRVNALPFRALALIWDEHYRDQNLQDKINPPTDDGPDPPTNYANPYRRGKRKDVFAGALPWPQKGPQVTMPLGDTAAGTIDANQFFDATPSGDNIPNFNAGGQQVNLERQGGSANAQFNASGTGGAASWADAKLRTNIGGAAVTVNLADATAASINLVRQSVAIQQLLEKDARGGSRYTESILVHFGVSSPDSRQQRPELISTHSFPTKISVVPATNQSTEVNLGELAGYGVGGAAGVGGVYSATEHGVIIGLLSTRAPLTMQQGLERMWSKRDRWEYFYPNLQHIGQQAVLNQEIYFQDKPGETADDDQGVFGYQERYYEYKQSQSMVTGTLRSNPVIAQTLDPWHLALNFTSLPKLDKTFIEDHPPIPRILKVQNARHFVADVGFQISCVRPMALYATPGLRSF